MYRVPLKACRNVLDGLYHLHTNANRAPMPHVTLRWHLLTTLLESRVCFLALLLRMKLRLHRMSRSRRCSKARPKTAALIQHGCRMSKSKTANNPL